MLRESSLQKKLFITTEKPDDSETSISMDHIQKMFRKNSPRTPLKTSARSSPRPALSRNFVLNSLRTSPRTRFDKYPTIRNIAKSSYFQIRNQAQSLSRLKRPIKSPTLTKQKYTVQNLRTTVDRMKELEARNKERERNNKSQIQRLEALMDTNREEVNEKLRAWKIRYLVEGESVLRSNGYKLGKFKHFDHAIINSSVRAQRSPAIIKDIVNSTPTKPKANEIKEALQTSTENKIQELYKEAENSQSQRKARCKRAISKLAISVHFITRLMKSVRTPAKPSLDPVEALKIAFPSKPFQNPEASEFMSAIKDNDLPKVRAMLEKNRFLVYDYDSFGRTGLHVAIHRGYIALAELLLKSLSDPNATDTLGRTPLFIAAMRGFFPLVKLLLFYKASPFLETKGGQSSLDVARTKPVKKVLEEAVRIYEKLNKIKNLGERDLIWKLECVKHFSGNFTITNDTTNT